MNYRKALKEIRNDPRLSREFDIFSEGTEHSSEVLVWHYINDDRSFERGICGFCGKRTKFINVKWGYNTYCSRSCANRGNTGKRLKTVQKKYGGRSPLQHPEIRQKALNTLKERYGDENYARSSHFSETIKKNSQKKYGVDHHLNAQENKAKIRKGMKVKWGKNNVANHPIIQQKIKASLRQRHGVEHPSHIHLDKELVEVMHSATWWKEIVLDEGLSPREIMEETGLSRPFVYRQLKKFGLIGADQSGEFKSPDDDLFMPIF